MPDLLLPGYTRRGNAQLGEKERTCVYLSIATGRILGFGHESMTPMFQEGWTRILLSHARELDRYAELYRRQEIEDAQSEDYFRTMREAPARNAIRSALRARRNHVNAINRAYIDANLRMMDIREERMRKRRQAAQSCLLVEKYGEKVTPEEIALDSPVFKAGPNALKVD